MADKDWSELPGATGAEVQVNSGLKRQLEGKIGTPPKIQTPFWGAEVYATRHLEKGVWVKNGPFTASYSRGFVI